MSSAAAEAPAFPRLAGDGVADVGLLLEGTYPYVSGGVSTWVHEIITGFPDLTFGICFLGATPETYGDAKYRLPANVVHVEVHHLMANRPPARPRRARPDRRRAPPPRARAVARGDARGHRAVARGRRHAGRRSTATTGSSLYDFLHDDRVFAELCAEYDAHQPETSFIDYFWTLRTMHVPLFKLAAIARALPRFRALHAVSTGYAGALGALVHRRTEAPFILTEHGIYTKERAIDLAHAAWIKDAPAGGVPQRVRQLAPALDPVLRGAGAHGLRRRRPDHLPLRGQSGPPDRRRRGARAHPRDPERHRPGAVRRRAPRRPAAIPRVSSA